jgi:hypothetical protein
MTVPTGNPPGRPRKQFGTPGPRAIHPSMADSETLAECSVLAQLLFDRLITQADDQGRLKGSARHVRATCVPLLDDVTTADVDSALEELAKVGAILRYQLDGQPFVQIAGWWEYQQMRFTWPSRLPAPEGWQDRTHTPSEHDDRVSSVETGVSADDNRVSDGTTRLDPARPDLTGPGGLRGSGGSAPVGASTGVMGAYVAAGGRESDKTRELLAEMVNVAGEDQVVAALHEVGGSSRTLISRTRVHLGLAAEQNGAQAANGEERVTCTNCSDEVPKSEATRWGGAFWACSKKGCRPA